MGYTQMWAVIDDNSTIHFGNETEMKTAFDVMTLGQYAIMEYYDCSKKAYKALYEKWFTDYTGDLKLIQIHDIHK